MMARRFLDDSEHWRYRAEKIRMLADDMNDEKSRATMLRIAADYDELARRAEARINASRTD